MVSSFRLIPRNLGFFQKERNERCTRINAVHLNNVFFVGINPIPPALDKDDAQTFVSCSDQKDMYPIR